MLDITTIQYLIAPIFQPYRTHISETEKVTLLIKAARNDQQGTEEGLWIHSSMWILTYYKTQTHFSYS